MASAGPGDIAAITKLKNTVTGDTLTVQSRHREVEPMKIPEGGMRFAVEPKNRGDEDKIFSALEKINLEDPSVVVTREASTHETIVTCMGQQHMDITVERIKRKFNVELLLKTPKVPYRETIKGKAEAQGRHKKQSGGRGQFGDCWLRVNPRTRGEGFKFNNEIFGGAVPKNYIPAIEKGVVETMEKGFLAGFPMVDIECTVYDGSYHSVDSSDMAFKIAAAKGFKLALAKASPVLLEPIMTAEISVPDDTTGDVIGDLNGRRGRVISMDPDGDMQVIKAEVPLAEMLTYTPSLRSMTSDRGSFDLEFRGYEEVPPHAAEKVIEEYKGDLSDDDS
jgi:elongation factor G